MLRRPCLQVARRGGAGPGAAALGEGGGWGRGARGGSSGLGAGGDRAAEGPTAPRARPGVGRRPAAPARGAAGAQAAGAGAAGAARPARRDEVAECRGEAGADRARAGGLRPGRAGARGLAEGGWRRARPISWFAPGGGSGCGTPRRAPRGHGAPRAPGAVRPARTRGAQSRAPRPGQVLRGRASLCSGADERAAPGTAAFAGRSACDPVRSESPAPRTPGLRDPVLGARRTPRPLGAPCARDGCGDGAGRRWSGAPGGDRERAAPGAGWFGALGSRGCVCWNSLPWLSWVSYFGEGGIRVLKRLLLKMRGGGGR